MEPPQAWVITAEMGYGHQRAVHPFRDIARDGIISLDSDPEASPAERRLWKQLLGMYEWLCRLKRLPLLGRLLFKQLDWLLYIPPMYPMRGRSRPSLQVRMLSWLVGRGLCGGVLTRLGRRPLPLLASFYAPAIAADLGGFSNLFVVICDADLSRAWVSENPRKSRIVYFAPCGRAAQRLKSYGVPASRIHLTGFPLPQSLIGGTGMPVLKADLGRRLMRLDPGGDFRRRQRDSVEKILGRDYDARSNETGITLTYAVGGAGAQQDIGRQIARSLSGKIAAGEVRLNLVAGIRPDVQACFNELKHQYGGNNGGIRVVGGSTQREYFDAFSDILHDTDILWSKPSELCFYCGLGIPMIMAPSIGPQERCNRKWLVEMQAGIHQENPLYTHEWLFDLLRYGRLADAAWAGFLNIRKLGTYQIRRILSGGGIVRDDDMK
jgi:hypothetical protein